MKRTLCTLTLTLLLGLLSVGCHDRNNTPTPTVSGESHPSQTFSTTSEDTPSAVSDTADTVSDTDLLSDVPLTEIVDTTGRSYGHIRSNGIVTLTDHGIFYTINRSDRSIEGTDTQNFEGNVGKTVTNYYLYDPRTGENSAFGSIPDQDYEAGYVRMELDGTLYTLLTTGNAMDTIPDPLLLVAFDLTAHTIQTYPISDNGFPYTAMTAADGKLLILNHDQTDTLHDRLYQFDPTTKAVREVLQWELKNNIGDSLRQVYCDGQHLYLLRVHFQGQADATLWLDTYDLSFRKQSERDISDLLKQSISDSLTPEDADNEIRQMVSRLLLLDGNILYYENFSTTRFVAQLDTGTLLDIPSGLGDRWLASSGSGEPFFYVAFDGAAENSVFDQHGDRLDKTLFHADDPHYYLTAASSSPDGHRLFQVDYTNPNDRNDSLPRKLYWVDETAPS